MSWLARKPIPIPTGVTVTVTSGVVEARGPNGTLSFRVHPDVAVVAETSGVRVAPATGRERTRRVSAQLGTTWALIRNAVEGVTRGFERQLELQGVGYRAEVSDRRLTLTVGFTHPVVIEAPEGVRFAVEKNRITVSGAGKELVGEVAASIRRVRPPEPYKGKGIRYVGEVVRRKAGKVAGSTAAGA